MSDSFDERIGHEAGEWFEWYVEDEFRFAGFVTERDRLFFDEVKHEIDGWDEASFATVAVREVGLRLGRAPKEVDAAKKETKSIEATQSRQKMTR